MLSKFNIESNRETLRSSLSLLQSYNQKIAVKKLSIVVQLCYTQKRRELNLYIQFTLRHFVNLHQLVPRHDQIHGQLLMAN